jgi:5-methyltetrahydrofolate--homocysteine methyltransferase
MNLLDIVELRPVVGDGAMGTMLLRKGLSSGESPEMWNLEKPEAIAATHKAYAEAGCDYVETNTFGANPIKLARHGLESRLDEMIKKGVDLARGAVGDACMVGGSMGPTGVLLEPYGDTPAEKVAGAFRASAKSLDEAGIDFFLVETMSDPSEAVLAIKAVKEVSSKPVAATMVFSRGAKGFRTMMGTSPSEAAEKLAAAGADIVGTNCCGGMSEALEIMKEIVSATSLPTIAQPNAGLPVAEGDTVVYPETPAAMADGLEDLLGIGVTIVGGCCGTTPEHIKQMAMLMGKAEHPPGRN